MSLLSLESFKIGFVVVAVVLFTERVLEIKFHKKIAGRIKSKWTTKAMICGHLFSFFGSLTELLLRDQISASIVATGFLIFGAGFLLRRWVMRTLGDLWSIDNEIRENHRLITGGPFTLCRHPNYFAIILEIVGFCLMANAYITLTLTLSLYVPILISRIKLEEAVLSVKFKDSYKTYRENTAVLIPGIKWELLEKLTAI